MPLATDILRNCLVETTKFKQRLGLHLPEGFNYLGAEDFVLDRGTPHAASKLTRKEREILLHAVDHCPMRQFQEGHCYYNAQMLAMVDPTHTLLYCEGLALGIMPFPTLHGWVLLNGKVVDLTWRKATRARGRFGDRVLGEIPEGWAYYGVTFDTDTVRVRMLRIGATGSFLEDIANGFPLFQEPRLRPVEELLCP